MGEYEEWDYEIEEVLVEDDEDFRDWDDYPRDSDGIVEWGWDGDEISQPFTDFDGTEADNYDYAGSDFAFDVAREDRIFGR